MKIFIQKKGQITIMTMHKSKGLEWDYVFLPFYDKENIFSEKKKLTEVLNFWANVT